LLVDGKFFCQLKIWSCPAVLNSVFMKCSSK